MKRRIFEANEDWCLFGGQMYLELDGFDRDVVIKVLGILIGMDRLRIPSLTRKSSVKFRRDRVIK